MEKRKQVAVVLLHQGRGESRLRGLCEVGSRQTGKADLPDSGIPRREEGPLREVRTRAGMIPSLMAVEYCSAPKLPGVSFG